MVSEMLASRVSRSSVQPPSRTTSGTRFTRAPRISGCAVKLGHTGTTATTSSPGPASACIAIIKPLTPDDVTAIREASHGRCNELT